MVTKQKYTTLEELNLAQKQMARKTALIEDDFLSIVKNPLNILSLSDSDEQINTPTVTKKKAATNNKEQGPTNGLLDIAQSLLGNMGSSSTLGLITNVVLPLLPTKKIGQSVARNAASIGLKVMAVNLAIWGFKKLKANWQEKKRKKKLAISRK